MRCSSSCGRPVAEEQRRRLEARGQNDPAELDRRLAEAEAEERLADRFDAVVVNDQVDRATEEVAAILAARRAAGSAPPERPEQSPSSPRVQDRTDPPWQNDARRLMEPRMETLLDRVDSKFTLVTLAAMRAREINDYYNQLGEGLGKIVPPQVTSVSRKPLSIALEEVEEGKIVAVPKPEEPEGDPTPTPRPPTCSRPPPTPRVPPRRRPASSSAGRAPMASPLLALRGRRIVLGVSGGIAAYKAVEVCRRLVDAGAHVAPVLTDDATRFVGALDVLGAGVGAGTHVAVRRPRPDPAHPARPERRPRRGRAGDGQAPRQVRARDLRRPPHRDPARHPGAGRSSPRRCTPRCGSTRPSRRTSRRCGRRGVHVVDPEEGRLAGGDVGDRPARRSRPHRRRDRRACSPRRGDLAGLSLLVTAGGTREAIDPVRFVGNRSSGKMGYAIAEIAARRGAAVTLVTTIGRPTPARGSTSCRSRPPTTWHERSCPGSPSRRRRHGRGRGRLPARRRWPTRS